ncbi:MAG: glycosyltransferase family 4 protein [Chloroflexota bacterium]
MLATTRSSDTIRRLIRRTERLAVQMRSRTWAPNSRLFLVSDHPNWVLSWEMREVAAIARHMGIHIGSMQYPSGVHQQSVFFASHFFLKEIRHLFAGNRVAFAYFHGKPTGSDGDFQLCYNILARHHKQVSRIQASYSEMRDIILESGIDQAKVFLIPIGINLSYFSPQTADNKKAARERFGLPAEATIIGSFQKDGTGWSEGLEPKLVKGPDVLLASLRRLKEGVPDLFVVLSGPARGYVKRGLEEAHIPFRHLYLDDYRTIGHLFHAIDLYIVASREEGGPKAILEAMASGVPLVTTRVGQAMDLVRHGENGWMVEVEDAEGLAHWARWAIEHQSDLPSVLLAGQETAQRNSYEAQVPLWATFFEGFVERG